MRSLRWLRYGLSTAISVLLFIAVLLLWPLELIAAAVGAIAIIGFISVIGQRS